MICLRIILTLVSCLLLLVDEKTFEIQNDKHYYCWCNKLKMWTNASAWLLLLLWSWMQSATLDNAIQDNEEEEEPHISGRQPQFPTISHRTEFFKFSVQTKLFEFVRRRKWQIKNKHKWRKEKKPLNNRVVKGKVPEHEMREEMIENSREFWEFPGKNL